MYVVIEQQLAEIPRSTAVLKEEDIRLNCSTSYPHEVFWRHIPFGKSNVTDVYVDGELSRSYATSGRYKIVDDGNIGRYDLVIENAQLEDAGTFICIDNYGNGIRVSVDVTVLGKYIYRTTERAYL